MTRRPSASTHYLVIRTGDPVLIVATFAVEDEARTYAALHNGGYQASGPHQVFPIPHCPPGGRLRSGAGGAEPAERDSVWASPELRASLGSLRSTQVLDPSTLEPRRARDADR